MGKRSALCMVLLVPVTAFVLGGIAKAGDAPRSLDINGHLRVDGVRELVVLFDPQGRTDWVRGDKAAHSIPGCKREVGRQGREVGEEEDNGDYVEFVFSKLLAGDYTLWIRPDSVVTAQLSGQLFWNPTGASVPCGPMGAEVQLQAHQWYRVDVVLGARTAADTCGFTLGAPKIASTDTTDPVCRVTLQHAWDVTAKQPRLSLAFNTDAEITVIDPAGRTLHFGRDVPEWRNDFGATADFSLFAGRPQVQIGDAPAGAWRIGVGVRSDMKVLSVQGFTGRGCPVGDNIGSVRGGSTYWWDLRMKLNAGLDTCAATLSRAKPVKLAQ